MTDRKIHLHKLEIQGFLKRNQSIILRSVSDEDAFTADNDGKFKAMPWGKIGEKIRVLETWGVVSHVDDGNELQPWEPDRPAKKVNEMPYGVGYYTGHVIYWCDGPFMWINEDGEEKSQWKPLWTMPKEASRLFVTPVSIQMKSLREITEDEAGKCGVDVGGYSGSAIELLKKHWEEMNFKGAWDDDMLVWVIEVTPELGEGCR